MQKWRIHPGKALIDSFYVPWSYERQITDPDPDLPKGTHHKILSCQAAQFQEQLIFLFIV